MSKNSFEHWRKQRIQASRNGRTHFFQFLGVVSLIAIILYLNVLQVDKDNQIKLQKLKDFKSLVANEVCLQLGKSDCTADTSREKSENTELPPGQCLLEGTPVQVHGFSHYDMPQKDEEGNFMSGQFYRAQYLGGEVVFFVDKSRLSCSSSTTLPK